MSYYWPKPSLTEYLRHAGAGIQNIDSIRLSWAVSVAAARPDSTEK